MTITPPVPFSRKFRFFSVSLGLGGDLAARNSKHRDPDTLRRPKLKTPLSIVSV
jgi:hypothetical protein